MTTIIMFVTDRPDLPMRKLPDECDDNIFKCFTEVFATAKEASDYLKTISNFSKYFPSEISNELTHNTHSHVIYNHTMHSTSRNYVVDLKYLVLNHSEKIKEVEVPKDDFVEITSPTFNKYFFFKEDFKKYPRKDLDLNINSVKSKFFYKGAFNVWKGEPYKDDFFEGKSIYFSSRETMLKKGVYFVASYGKDITFLEIN